MTCFGEAAMRGELCGDQNLRSQRIIEAMPFLIHFIQRLGLVDPRPLYIKSGQR